MDLWDLTKVMVRRWYVTAPMALATVAAAAWITATAGADYEATGHVAVIPAEVQRVATAGEPVRVSPWNEEALAEAARFHLEAKSLRDEVAEAGYTGEWTVQITGRLPVITLEVVAPTAEQAVETLHRLQEVIDEEVTSLQEELAVSEPERIRTVRYDTGESVDVTMAGVRRALVAVLGAGAVLTMVVVIAFDAIARGRRYRRDEAAGQLSRVPSGALSVRRTPTRVPPPVPAIGVAAGLTGPLPPIPDTTTTREANGGSPTATAWERRVRIPRP